MTTDEKWLDRFTKAEEELGYDPNDRESVLEYAKKLPGKTLRQLLNSAHISTRGPGKGDFGNELEKLYFSKRPDQLPEPDFPCGIELKSTPLKRIKTASHLVPKERLVLGMIDYNALSAETWEKSSFRKKNAALLIIFYEHDPDKAPLDLRINSICTWELPPEDFEIIRDDWEKIAQKARESRAHTLSESDTRYLAASTKGATGAQRRSQFGTDERAKPRAFSLKQGYLRYIFEKVVLGLSTTAPLPKASRKKNLETWVSEQFASYKGMTAAEIAKTLKLTLSPRAKGFHASITRSILGIAPDKEIEEFQKAEICCRTVRLQRNGNLSEYISFPAFDPKELVGQDWDTSDFRNQVVKRFMFVIYKADGRGAHRFEGVRFWSMPKQDLEQARQVWIETVKRLKGRSRSLPKKSESRVAHVRPHGRNSRDTFETPGGKMTKQSFWLNGDYIAEQLGLYRRKRKTGTKKRKRES